MPRAPPGWATFSRSSALPSFSAWVLPGGTSTRFTRYTRNQTGSPIEEIDTYTKTDGSIGARTNSFGFASNGIDLLTVTNALGVRVSSNYFNAYHQVLTNYDALNQITVYTYDAYLRPSTVQTPAGLLTTRNYGADARLSSVVDSLAGGSPLRTNSYTWNADGTLRSKTDPRGLAVTNYWDNLQRLTGVLYPDSTIS